MRDRRLRAETLIKIQLERVPHLFVGGLDVESEANSTIPVNNPTNGLPVGRCPAANARDIEKAVQTARRAFEDDWGQRVGADRGEVLWNIAEALDNQANDLAILESLQTGKTFRDALNHDVIPAIRALRYYAGWAGKVAGQSFDLGGGMLGYSLRDPHPVVGIIAPWNAPFGSALQKAAPALALGCSVVLLAPEEAPLTVLRLGELAHENGLPSGVLNVVTGFAKQAGEALAGDQKVGALFFSGRIEDARRLQVASARSNLKPIHMELGGKSAHILLKDAPLKPALKEIAESILTSRSILTSASARAIVHESLYEEFAALLTARAKSIVLGDPLDEHTELGPMINKEHMKRVLAYIELGRREGATLVAGGERETKGTRADGFFVKPTIFIDVKPNSRLAQEEISGPVLSVIPFKSEDDAIEIANQTIYGRATTLWTQHLSAAHRIIRRLGSGVIRVNHGGPRDAALPHGGNALSGHGTELGSASLGQYCRTKTIYIPSR